MLNKFKNWMDKPYTRGDVVKWSTASMAILAVEYVWLFYGDVIADRTKEIKETFGTNGYYF